MTNPIPACIYCEESSQLVPLILFQYQDKRYYICPQHLPILIHEPASLAAKVPGLERQVLSQGHS